MNKTQLDVLQYIRNNDLIRPNDTVCVCYSGGIDSSVLLHILFMIKDSVPFRLCACHMNHMIRGEESMRDERFCREVVSRKYEIPFFCTREDIPAIGAATGHSVESAGRTARYNWFKSLSKEQGIQLFATAHQKDDVAETLLYRMMRGTTVTGLKGIPKKRGEIIRPILFLSRKDIEEYADANDVTYIRDSSNDDNHYARNRIRNVIIPEMQAINPGVVDALNRLAEYASQDEDYIRGTCISQNPAVDHPAALRRSVSDQFENITGTSLCYYHLDAICEALSLRKDSLITLPDRWIAVCSNGQVRFSKAVSRSLPSVSFDQEVPLDQRVLVNRRCTVELSESVVSEDKDIADINVNNLSTEILLRKQGVCGKIRCRGRMPGDQILQFGMMKKLKKLISDQKIPIPLRPWLPVFYDDCGILCVPFVAVSDRVYAKSPDGSFRLTVSINNHFQREGECQ